MDTEQRNTWFADDAEDDGGIHIDQYDITASPNDFNLVTLGSFIDRGAVRIPGFQRHFVWDLPRASRLIESLILGLPVPQLFLYEESRNRFLVIDGQQRLMSIYYFIKRRFPRQESRQELRAVFDESQRTGRRAGAQQGGQSPVPHVVSMGDGQREQLLRAVRERLPGLHEAQGQGRRQAR